MHFVRCGQANKKNSWVATDPFFAPTLKLLKTFDKFSNGRHEGIFQLKKFKKKVLTDQPYFLSSIET